MSSIELTLQCIEYTHDTIALSIPNAIKLRDWLSEVINNATV